MPAVVTNARTLTRIEVKAAAAAGEFMLSRQKQERTAGSVTLCKEGVAFDPFFENFCPPRQHYLHIDPVEHDVCQLSLVARAGDTGALIQEEDAVDGVVPVLKQPCKLSLAAVNS